jgi:hypothetical protein
MLVLLIGGIFNVTVENWRGDLFNHSKVNKGDMHKGTETLSKVLLRAYFQLFKRAKIG